MLTYGASPIAAQTPPELHASIVHATLELDGIELTGVDLPSNQYQRPQGFYVTLNVAEAVDALRIFQALARGGTIMMPYQPTFWSSGFGVVVDRFGVPWEVNCTVSPGLS